MYPEDRVLVVYVPSPLDFQKILDHGWYRIPQKRAPKGLNAEYYAFYFGSKFGDRRWSVSYYGRRLGHELVRRIDLLPSQPNHPRANEPYYKVQLDDIQELERPIVSLRWRRITFIHTTWDRLTEAREINDLLVTGDKYVDRLYSTLRDQGLFPELEYRAGDGAEVESIIIPCDQGEVDIKCSDLANLQLSSVLGEIAELVRIKGGPIQPDGPQQDRLTGI